MPLVKKEKVKEAMMRLVGEAPEEGPPPQLELGKGKAVGPIKSNKLILQQMQAGGEAYYFWLLNFLRNPNALNYKVDKISDVYTATETSSYFGAIEAKKESQMRNASQYLQTVGMLTKNLFQMIRELRIIDERRDYYDKSEQGDESAEVALKGIWVSMVEGGAENPTSVTGMARKLGFVIVPDLFFKLNPKTGSKGVDREVNKLKDEGINARIRSVVKQKLFQYYVWKERTGKELSWRKNFVLKSLTQTYHSIKMYGRWLKPYLRNIRRLQMSGVESPDLVTAFESSMIELELFGVQETYELETEMGSEEKPYTEYFPCIRIKFHYITRPEMAFQQEYAHRGALHAGRTTIEIEGYVLTKSQLDQYRQKKEDEDLELLKSVDESVESLGDELKKYLEEAGELEGKKVEKKEVKHGMTEGILEPFVAVFKGFGEIFSGLAPERKVGGKKVSEFEKEQQQAAARAVAKHVYTLYDVFKKAHQMLSW